MQPVGTVRGLVTLNWLKLVECLADGRGLLTSVEARGAYAGDISTLLTFGGLIDSGEIVAQCKLSNSQHETFLQLHHTHLDGLAVS